MKPEIRFQTILSLLDKNGRVTVDELTTRFGVSAETIRRDLALMSEQGLVRKIYGGAVRLQLAQESSFALRGNQFVEQKQAIARYAVRFVKKGDSLFISAGTTTTIFARTLVQYVERLIIMTNSPAIERERTGILHCAAVATACIEAAHGQVLQRERPTCRNVERLELRRTARPLQNRAVADDCDRRCDRR